MDEEERKAFYRRVLAKLSRVQVVLFMQETVQRMGPMPDVVAEAFKERLAEDGSDGL